MGVRKNSAIGTAVPSRSAIRSRRTTSSRECPPRANRSSSAPTAETSSTSAKISQRAFSNGVSGARPRAPNSGTGRAALSSFPLGVTGNASSGTIAAGTMYSGSDRATNSRSRAGSAVAGVG